MNLSVAAIQKHELAQLMLEEAFKEGWLYSQEDVDFYFDHPRNKISAIKVNNELAGCVILHDSIGQAQNKPIRSAGLFLVTQKYRSQKMVGPHLLESIAEDIKNNVIVCFHAVPRAVEYYERLGFQRTSLIDLYYSVKIENVNQEIMTSVKKYFELGVIKKIDNHDFNINFYNTNLFLNKSGSGFTEFVELWIRRPDAVVLGYYENDILKGYGVNTICKESSNTESKEICYRISPIYAETSEIASTLLNALVYSAVEAHGVRIDLNSLATSDTKFGKTLKEIGFSEIGKNYIVCNYPQLISRTLKTNLTL